MENQCLINKLIGNSDMFMFFKLVRSYYNKLFKKFKITPVQFEVLYLLYISKEKAIKMSVLGNELEMAKSGVTLLIDKMVSKGLVDRHFSIEDRRIINIELASKGAKVINEIIENNSIFKSSILEFTTEEKLLLCKLATRIRKEYYNDIYV